MADISKIKLPSGNEYQIKDQTARDLIAAINNWSYIVCTNAENTPKDVEWSSGGTTITGTLEAASTTMYKIYLVPVTNGTNDAFMEYITVNPSSSTYEWEIMGSTSAPDLSQYVSKAEAGNLAYNDTASGSVSVPSSFTTTFTGKEKTVSVSGTTAGSVSETKGTVAVKKASSGTATYTPEGSNASSSVSGSCTVTATGSVSAPTISVKTAGSTASVTGISNVGAMPTYTVASEVLTITSGSAPTAASAVTVKTSDAEYEATAPTFTGTSATGTISGTAAAQTFTGTGARLETDGQVLTGASFSGASMTSTGSYTPEATSVSTTVAGSTSQTVTVS